MNLVGIVLARKNSKRLKKKKNLLIKKKKLINYTLDLLKRSKNFSNIVISTDDEKIFKIAKKYPKFIVLKRPKLLSLDSTKSYQVIRHAYNWYIKNFGNIDGIFVFQPTSPFRTKHTINKMVKAFKKNKMRRSVISVSPICEHPEWMLKIKKNKIVPYVDLKSFSKMSQKLEKLYRVNGLGYLLSSKDIKREKTLIPKNSLATLSNTPFEDIDIDTKQDLIKARLFFK